MPNLLTRILSTIDELIYQYLRKSLKLLLDNIAVYRRKFGF